MSSNVGVVIRTKDRPLLLDRAIKSVFNQSINSIEIVVVNDGGDKDSVNNVINKYKKINKIEINAIHNQVSRGMEASSNLGLKSLNTKYLTLLDDDDTWDPNILKTEVNELEKNHNKLSSIMGVSTLSQVVYELIINDDIITQNVIPLEDEARLERQNYIINLGSLLKQNLFTNNSFLYFYDVLHEVGYYRENLPVLGDWEFNIRFAKQFDILVIQQHLAFYHKRVEQNNVNDNSKINLHQEYYQVLRNQWIREDLNKNDNLGSYTILLPLISKILENQTNTINLQNQIVSLLAIIGNDYLHK